MLVRRTHPLRRVAIAALLGSFACNSNPLKSGATLPSAAVDILDHADTFEIYALDPQLPGPHPDPKTTLGGHNILAHATITDRDAQRRIWKAIDDGVRGGDPNSAAACFNPRHGVRAIKDGKTVDLVICFECAEVELYRDGVETDLHTKNVRNRLDVEFKAAGVEALPDR